MTLKVPTGASAIDVQLPANARQAVGVYSYASYLMPGGLARCNLTNQVTVTMRLKQDAVECSGK